MRYKVTESLTQRFWEKVDKRGPDDCWEWTGALNGTGLQRYGRIGIDAVRVEYAHRVSWTIHKGHIPKGLIVMHACDNPRCVNPDHLSVGTKSDNTQDMLKKGRGYAPFRDKSRWGEAHHNSKLTEKEVREIRRKYEKGAALRALGREYGIDGKQVSNIVKRLQWRHVE